MVAFNHTKRNERERMARAGADRINDYGLPGGLNPPKARKSKADQRAELVAATARINRRIACPCGHSATIAVPPSWAGRRFSCSKCGRVV